MSRGWLRCAPVAVTLSLVVSGRSWAETEFDISADLRTRYEVDDRAALLFAFLRDAPVQHTVFARTRVRLDAKQGDGAEAVVELQDSRYWGMEQQTTRDARNVDLHQGYLRFTPWSLGTVDLGRQELLYAREHVFGDADFDNVGQAFDAVKLHTEFSESWLDVLFGKVADYQYGHDVENVTAGFVHFDISQVELAIEPFLLYKENRIANQFLTAFGTYAGWGRGRLSVDGDFVGETGQIDGDDISAYLAAADLGWDFSADIDDSRCVEVGYEMYTGDDDSLDDKFEAYDPLYADNHGYYGIMDIADTFANEFGVGLHDLYVKFWTDIAGKVTCTLAGHDFRTDADTAASGDHLGQELDLIVHGRVSEGIVLEAGGGLFLSGDLIEATFDDQDATWGYVQATGSF